jgi:phosphoglycerate dehydrogenase-like enzyme
MREIVTLNTIWLNDDQRARLQALGRLTLHDALPASRAELLARLEPAEIVMLSEVHLDREALQAAPRLKMISLWSAGFDTVDIQAARDLNITVCHAPGCSATAIAEHTLAVAIYFTHRLREADQHVRQGGFSWEPFNTPELFGQTVGVVGFGRIGRRVAEYALALGCRVLAHTRNPSPERAAGLDVQFVDLKTLLEASDVISINVALTPETAGMIGSREFGWMARRPILVNTARGQIIDQDALRAALQTGQIRAASLDVLAEEPPAANEPLLKMENVLFSPRSAGASQQTFTCLSELCVRNIEAFLAGTPQHVLTS